jgi:hypothetical protein
MSMLRIRLPRASERLDKPAWLLLREPTALEFHHGGPDVFPNTDCFVKMDGVAKRANLAEQHRWADELIQQLAVCAHDRPMTGACAVCKRSSGGRVRLGADRDHVVETMMREWRQNDLDDAGGAFAMPGPNARSLLAAFAKRANRLPHELAALPISDFNFDYRILFEPDFRRLQRKAQKPATPPLAMNDDSEFSDIPAEAVLGE